MCFLLLMLPPNPCTKCNHQKSNAAACWSVNTAFAICHPPCETQRSATPCFGCQSACDLPESGNTAAMQAPAADEDRSDLRVTCVHTRRIRRPPSYVRSWKRAGEERTPAAQKSRTCAGRQDCGRERMMLARQGWRAQRHRRSSAWPRLAASREPCTFFPVTKFLPRKHSSKI